MSKIATPREPAKTESPSPARQREERIRIRAYELYEKRHGEAGDAESDWYRAEAELDAKAGERAK